MYSANNHPIIPTPSNNVRDVADSNVDTFFATISSEDRNVVKYPHSNSFTVQLPQDYSNITSINLHDSFIPNVSVNFTLDRNNVDLVFRFTDIPTTYSSDTEIMIYLAIKHSIEINNYYRIRIADGSYTQKQLLLEVQNRMNQIVGDAIVEYYKNNNSQTTYRWGEHIYSSTGQTDADEHPIYFHSNYHTYELALDAYNSIAGTTEPLNLELSNAFAHSYGSSLTPPPLLVIRTIENETEAFLGTGTYAPLNSIANGVSNSFYNYAKLLLAENMGYTYFTLFYDEIQKKIVFGNKISAFEVVMDFAKYYAHEALDAAGIRIRDDDTTSCTPACDSNRDTHVNYINWGLPTYLGFSGNETTKSYAPSDTLPTFYYYNKTTEPDMYNPFQHATTEGFINSSIYVITPCNQLNIRGDAYYYMEIDGINMIDELLPYKNNAYAVTNGITNGIINSIFAKRLIYTLPRGSIYKEESGDIKTFTPPLRRMNKVSVRIRYHDGIEPNFGTIPFILTLKIVCQKNQLNRTTNPGFAAHA
jgi:hypothetical protein